MQSETQIMEINLISAQGLKTPSANLRRMQTYALAWVHPSAKLRTPVDRLGGENPTWNDKFLFRVSPEFLSSDTSAVVVEIYAVGYIKDFLVGTVRFLLSSCLKTRCPAATPAFTAVQVRRPSGRFQGILNIAVAVYKSSDFTLLSGRSAISFRDLIGERNRRDRRLSRIKSKSSEQSSGAESCGDSFDYSDGAESTTSSSSATSTALKEWNGGAREEMAGTKESKSNGVGLLCGLAIQKKINLCAWDQNFQFWDKSVEKEN